MGTLVIFDIDGTLLDTVLPHQTSYVSALGPFGFESVDTDWSGYPEHLDSAILHEIMRVNLGRRATENEITRFDADLASEFRRRWDRTADRMRASSLELLAWLRDRPDTTVVFATGGLAAVTEVKLQGLGKGGSPAATASESETRHALVEGAILLGGAVVGRDRVVSVGDGIWDARAAFSAGVEFIGVGERGAAAFTAEHPEAAYVCEASDLVRHPIW